MIFIHIYINRYISSIYICLVKCHGAYAQLMAGNLAGAEGCASHKYSDCNYAYDLLIVAFRVVAVESYLTYLRCYWAKSFVIDWAWQQSRKKFKRNFVTRFSQSSLHIWSYTYIYIYMHLYFYESVYLFVYLWIFELFAKLLLLHRQLLLQLPLTHSRSKRNFSWASAQKLQLREC